jgi:aryl-alcohol dehydrogenase-like predicted oxidoreductase
VEERAKGGIGRIGVSATTPEEASELLDAPDVDIIQVASSLLDQRLLRAGFFGHAASLGRELHVRSIYLQGAAHLSIDALPEHLVGLRRPLRELDSIAAAAGVTRLVLFLGWARHRLAPARIIIGCETVQQLLENLAAWEVASSGTLVELLETSMPELPDRVLDPRLWTRSNDGS